MSKTTIPTGGITADAIDATLIADDAVSEEHLDATALTGNAALAEAPSDTDEFLFSDGGTLKRIDYSYIKGELNRPAFKAYLGSNQSISGGGNTVAALDTSEYILGSGVSFGSNKFTFSTAGKYFFNYNFRISSSEGDGFYVSPKFYWYDASSTTTYEVGINEYRQGGSGALSLGHSTIIDIAASDEVSLRIYAGDDFTLSSGQYMTYLQGFRIA